jgi:hypothetical protein
MKCHSTSRRLHGAVSQKAIIFWWKGYYHSSFKTQYQIFVTKRGGCKVTPCFFNQIPASSQLLVHKNLEFRLEKQLPT